MTDLDEWRDVLGFPGWYVNQNGAIKNHWSAKVLSYRSNHQNVPMVNLWHDGRINTRSAALIVAHAFLDTPPNLSYNSVIHLNGDRLDCRANNLMWRPRWFTIRYHQMFKFEPTRLAVRIPETQEIFHSLREACTTYGLIERSTYVNVLNDEPCFHYGWYIERFET